jgi:hypothetical protein
VLHIFSDTTLMCKCIEKINKFFQCYQSRSRY